MAALAQSNLPAMHPELHQEPVLDNRPAWLPLRSERCRRVGRISQPLRGGRRRRPSRARVDRQRISRDGNHGKGCQDQPEDVLHLELLQQLRGGGASRLNTLIMVADLPVGALFFEWAGALRADPGRCFKRPSAHADGRSQSHAGAGKCPRPAFAALGSGHKLQNIQAWRESTGLGPYPDNTLRADAGGRNTKVVNTSVGGDGLRHLGPVYGVHPRRAEGS